LNTINGELRPCTEKWFPLSYSSFFIFNLILLITHHPVEESNLQLVYTQSVSVALNVVPIGIETLILLVSGRLPKGQFGNQRLFGSAGWGLLAVAAGLIVDAFSDGSDVKNYTPAFYLMLVPMIGDIICTFFLRVSCY